MFQDHSRIRRHGSQDFSAYYDFVCARRESYPLPSVKMDVHRGILDLNGDRVKPCDWPPILDSLSINKHLHHVAVSSSSSSNNKPLAGLESGDTDRRFPKSSVKRRAPAIRSKEMTYKLCISLQECLTVTTGLKTLQLNGLPLRERDLIVLTKGLAQNICLEKLSLAHCPIKDQGVEVVCQSVKYSPSIRSVDFSGCGLTWRGAEHMAMIIKHQGMQRHGTAWAESLRYRQPSFEGMQGLRRVTLNSNPLIGDRGVAALALELAEDLWLKALDLQKCGLSNVGATRLLQALKTNSHLCVLDIRCNPLVDKSLIKTILEKVLMNGNGQSPEYGWIKPSASDHVKSSGPRGGAPSHSTRKETTKAAPNKDKSAAVSRHQSLDSRRSHLPWRTAARAHRQRGTTAGVTVDNIFQGLASVKLTVESASDEEDEDEEEEEEEEFPVQSDTKIHSQILQNQCSEKKYELIQMELKECRLKLTEERRSRLEAESRLRECELEIARLRNRVSGSEGPAATRRPPGTDGVGALEDEAVLKSIEHSFNKFHSFLDLFKDAGLGHLATMAGIDSSDFSPLGKPQLSSTFGRRADSNADSPTRAEAEAGFPTYKINGGGDSCLVGSVLSDHGENQNEIKLLESSTSDAKRRLPLNPVLGSVEEDEEEPEEFLVPDTMDDSGSEKSCRSQRSSRNVLLRKTFQTQTGRESPSNSHHSNSHQSNSHHSNSHHSNSHHSNSHHSNSHHSNSHQSNSHHSNSHQSNSHQSNSHQSNSHHSNSHQSNSHHSNSHHSNSHHSNSHQSNSHHSNSHQSNSHQSNSHHSNSHQSNSHQSRGPRSNGSVGRCLDYVPLRQASHSSHSADQSSGRSSVSDACVASVGSGAMRSGRLVAVGQSDSDGSDGKSSSLDFS